MLHGVPPGPFDVHVVDEGVTRSAIEGAGDVGLATDLALAPDGSLAIAYVDRLSSEIWFATLDPAGSWEESVPFVLAPEVAEPGRDALPPTLVGAQIQIAFDEYDQPMVLYQDASNVDLLLSVRTPDGWWVSELAMDGACGFSPHLYPRIGGQTWILHGAYSDGGDGDVNEQIRARVVPF